PRHPHGRDHGLRTRQQVHLADRDQSRPRRPRHGDRPAPPAVAGRGAGEQVRQHAVALGGHPEVVADAVALGHLEGRVPRPVDRGTARAARATARRVGAAAGAEGAGESGLARVLGLHAVSAAGDALVLLSLATTVFFSVPVGEARSRVALYLAVTMLPFS